MGTKASHMPLRINSVHAKVSKRQFFDYNKEADFFRLRHYLRLEQKAVWRICQRKELLLMIVTPGHPYSIHRHCEGMLPHGAQHSRAPKHALASDPSLQGPEKLM
jgi:hypothetical protein